MNNKHKLTCIICPIGCEVEVQFNNDKYDIKGLKCEKGRNYIINEIYNPKRILTSSVLVEDGIWPLVSVKTSKPIPKEKIFDVINEIKKMKIIAPVFIGQKIKKNVSNTGVDILATKTIIKKIED